MQYKILKAGDVRQEGDEVKVTAKEPFTSYNEQFRDFVPINLVGHPILPVDLVNCEYRRPV